MTLADAPIRRLVAVAPNPSVDKIVAVERLVPGEIHRPTVLSVVPGGKALNVARPAHALGLPATVIPILAGHAGRWILDGLVAAGVTVRPVWSDGETRECTSILDRATGALTELYEPGARIGAAVWAALESALAAELANEPEATVVAVSGSLPAGAPPDGHRRIVEAAAHAGARCAVDVGGRSLREALAAGPWLAKGNAAEAAEATGISTDDEAGVLAAAHALRAGGATSVLVSRGADGALLLDATGAAWRVGPPPERGAFPVGSGDSLLAGYLAGLAAGHPPHEAIRQASAAAAANALHPGQGVLDPVDINRLLPAISVEPIEA